MQVQIAGAPCNVCKGAIVFAQDGKFCPSCGVVVHRKCETESTCPQCKQPYAEQTSGDSASVGIVPRALRSEMSAAPIIAVVLAVLVTLVLLFVWATNG
jgi:uncharacterized membrane protein YvbJ